MSETIPLTLVPNPAPVPRRPVAPAIVAMLPTACRPSEMAATVELHLDDTARGRIAREAARHGVSPAGWVRWGVEAARHLEQAARLTGRDVGDLQAALERVAAEATPVSPLSAAPLGIYARRLQRSTPTSKPKVPRKLLVSLPDELAGTWANAAAAAHVDLSCWALDLLARSPESAPAWEAAAAADCRYLGEWVLVSALASNA